MEFNSPEYRQQLIRVLTTKYGVSSLWCASSTTPALERALDWHYTLERMH